MSGSAPEDLAVAFRSFPRRLSSVLSAAEDDAARTSVGPLTNQLDDLIRATARSLRVPPQGDLPTLSARVADAIESVPADQWTNEMLDEVRTAGLEGGRLLRQIEAQLSR